jgi:hypothetical protein
VPIKNNKTVSEPFGPLNHPAEFRSFAEPSLLLPGEDLRDYEVLRQMIVEDVQPQTNIEWLWTLDLVELSWEILISPISQIIEAVRQWRAAKINFNPIETAGPGSVPRER